MRKLEYADLSWALRLCPTPLLKLLQQFPNEIFVAGGYIRSVISNEKVNDIDVFTPTAEKAMAYALMLVNGNHENIYKTDNAITVKGLRYPIQFVHRWSFNTAEDCVNSFDFSICRAGFFWNKKDGEDGKWESLCEDNYYSDLAGKRLVYMNPIRNEDAGGSMLRVLKYYQNGFRIPLDSLGSVITRLVMALKEDKVDMSSHAEVSRVITALLREVDPNVDPNHISHLPSFTEEQK